MTKQTIAAEEALSSTAPPAATASPLPPYLEGLQLFGLKTLAVLIGCTERHAENVYRSGHIRSVEGVGRLVRFSAAEFTRFTEKVRKREVRDSVLENGETAAT